MLSNGSDKVGKFIQVIERFWRDETGPTAVEYAVILALIAGVCTSSVLTLAQVTQASLDASSGAINSVL